MIRGSMLALVMIAAVSGGWSTVRAQSPRDAASMRPMLLETTASETLLEQGREALLDFRMDESERHFRRLERRGDGAAAASFHLTSAALLRFLMSDDDAEYQTFHERADSTIRLLSGEPPSAWRDYLHSELELQRSVALAKRDEFVRAAWAARSAYKGLDRIVAEFPDFYEPYKSLGLLHLAIGSMPRSYRFILRILGYEGSIVRGLEELEMARTRSHYASDEAAAYLALSHSMLYLSRDRSLELIERLHDRDPESVLVSYLYGTMLIWARRTEEAAELLLSTKERAAGPLYFYIDYLDFFLAEALFRNGEFSEAASAYRAYIEGHPGKAGKAMAYLHLGLSLEMTGRRDAAVAYYDEVTAARQFDTDEVARRAAKQLAASPMSATDRALLLARCAYDSGRLEEAERQLGRLLSQSSLTDEQRAEAAYRLGRVKDALEQNAAAINAYRVAIQFGRASPGRWAPWGQFFIGKILEREGRHDAARTAYREAASYGSRHDFHRALEQAIRAAVR